MNTTAKGDAFETEMFKKIEQMVKDDELPISSKHAKVFSKKSYFSEKRKSKITVDISIECTLPGEPEPSLLVIIECKDLNRPVGVEDLEEFESKVSQISRFNVKAMFLTKTRLRESALNVAIANKVRVMKINQDGSHTVLSFRKERSVIGTQNKDFINAVLSLTAEPNSRMTQPFIGLGSDKVFHSLQAILSDTMTSL